MSRLPPELVGAALSSSKNYRHYTSLITDDDIVTLLPEWFVSLVRGYRERGNLWINNEISCIRNMLNGGTK